MKMELACGRECFTRVRHHDAEAWDRTPTFMSCQRMHWSRRVVPSTMLSIILNMESITFSLMLDARGMDPPSPLLVKVCQVWGD